MIIRIVKMYFSNTSAGEFLGIFKANEEAIRNFPGCSHLELLRDTEVEFCYCTLSHWNDLESLEAYRASPLFKNVWVAVKPLFSKRTEVCSLERVSLE